MLSSVLGTWRNAKTRGDLALALGTFQFVPNHEISQEDVELSIPSQCQASPTSAVMQRGLLVDGGHYAGVPGNGGWLVIGGSVNGVHLDLFDLSP